MDNKWSGRLAKNTESAKYVPQGLQQESYALEENGKWENVNYEGQTRCLWRPTVVDASWSPFTNGRWVSYYGDQVWVPYESFGYVTHHYGNWVWVDASNSWYWAPPVATYVATGPYLPVEYAWYPGEYPGFTLTNMSAGYRFTIMILTIHRIGITTITITDILIMATMVITTTITVRITLM